MANGDTEDDYFSPIRNSNVVNDDKDDAPGLVANSDSDSDKDDLDDEDDEDFSTSGGFTRRKSEKLRPNRSLLT